MASRSLIHAIHNGSSLETIEKLVESGTAVNGLHDFEYLFDLAVDVNNEEVVKLLLQYVDCDICITGHGRNKTVLHRACEQDNPNPEIVQAILEYGISINYVDDYGETALHLACKTRNKEVVQLLIDYGIDINYVDETSDCCCSAIYYAICKETTEIFELLLKHGAEIFLVTTSNCSVYSAAKSAPEIAKLMLEFAVSLSSEDEITWNNLSLSIFNNDFKVTKHAIENGHEIDMLCVYTAIVSDNTDIMKIVWKHVPPDTVSKDLYFMIHVFDNWNYEETLEKLWMILNKEKVNLHLERCGKAFAFFINRVASIAFGNVSNEEQRAVLSSLYNRGLRLSELDVERILYYMSYPHSSLLLHNIISIFLPKVNRGAFRRACDNALDKTILPYCLEADFDAVLESDMFKWTVEKLKYYLARFTFSCKDDLIYFIRRSDREEVMEEINPILERIQFKSLVELSRDVVRRQLSHVCKDSRQMFSIFDELNLPIPIRDIIQCKTPINRLEIN